jgi:hypothetical protein
VCFFGKLTQWVDVTASTADVAERNVSELAVMSATLSGAVTIETAHGKKDSKTIVRYSILKPINRYCDRY